MTSKISMAYFILFFLISYFKNLHFGKKDPSLSKNSTKSFWVENSIRVPNKERKKTRQTKRQEKQIN